MEAHAYVICINNMNNGLINKKNNQEPTNTQLKTQLTQKTLIK